MKKKILLSSALVILVCLSLIAGATFALFTSGDTVSMVVGSATVNVTAEMSEPSLSSFGRACSNGTFENLGTATVTGNKLDIVNMTPGDKVTFTITLTNHSNILTGCKVKATSSSTSTKDLAGALEISYSLNNSPMTMNGNYAILQPKQNPNGDNVGVITVTVYFPSNHTDAFDNEYQAMNTSLTFTVEAIQGNGIDADGNRITQ